MTSEETQTSYDTQIAGRVVKGDGATFTREFSLSSLVMGIQDFCSAPQRASGLGPPLPLEPLEIAPAVVDVHHRVGHGAVTRLFGDRSKHLLRDAAIRGVALGARAQLDQMQRLARVHLHDAAHPVRERDRVAGLHREVADHGVVEGPGALERLHVDGLLAGL